MSYLEIDDVTKEFGDLTAVDGVSLSIEEGSFVTIVGPSGSGKSTLLRTIAGLETLTSGEIRLEGESITNLPPYRRNIGLVFQDYALFPHKTVFENIAFGIKMRGGSRAEREERVDEMLEMMDLEGYEEKYPGECSGGEKQRIAMARALAFDPDLVLMDEPLSTLDKNLRERLRNELRDIQAKTGVTTIYVTHNQNEALSLGDRLAVLNEGRLEQYDAPETVYRNPATKFVANFLGQATQLRGRVETRNGTRMVALDDGGTLELPPDDSLEDGDSVALFLRDEKLTLERASPDSVNSLAGVIEDVDYRGREINYFVRTPAVGTTLQVSHTPSEGESRFYDTGADVHVSIPPEGLTYVREPDGETASDDARGETERDDARGEMGGDDARGEARRSDG